MSGIIRAEQFLGSDYIESELDRSFESVEISVEELLAVEYEREKFMNARSTTKMLTHMIDGNTIVDYPSVTRSRFEVRNGYKRAMGRGVNLNEVKIFNLLFRCLQGKLKTNGVALMTFGPAPHFEEWVMLCPDDTRYTIQREKRRYLDVAAKMVFDGHMDNDDQNELIANLRALNVGTRCANSLIHEYGHVLQYRMWRNEGIAILDPKVSQDDINADIYDWFDELGYVELLSLRIPGFDRASEDDILLYLKEGFVEDYRIVINRHSQKGLYELPNAYCWRGDFELPELLDEGVDIVRKALEQYDTERVMGRQEDLSSEPDRISLVDQMMAKGRDFQAGRSPMSASERRAVSDRLRNKNRQLHVAL